MQSFPTENAVSRRDGGGGNRTRETFPTPSGAEFRILCYGKSGGMRCTGCPENEPVALCAWVEQTRWWQELPFALCADCIEKFGSLRGWVYFVRGGDAVKIGYSADPAKRLRDLAVGSPVPLELLHRTPGTVEDEAAFHARFSADRMHGEWFRLSDDLRAYLAEAPGACSGTETA